MLGVCRAALALVPEKLATQGARRQDRTAAPKVKVLLTLLGREGGGERAGVGGRLLCAGLAPLSSPETSGKCHHLSHSGSI